MKTYEDDVVAGANEQAHLLRAGRLDLLDIAHIADLDWSEALWLDARTEAKTETAIGFDTFPSAFPWTASAVLNGPFPPR